MKSKKDIEDWMANMHDAYFQELFATVTYIYGMMYNEMWNRGLIVNPIDLYKSPGIRVKKKEICTHLNIENMTMTRP